jgi:O-antigen/teichoic acid export membrane protein
MTTKTNMAGTDRLLANTFFSFLTNAIRIGVTLTVFIVLARSLSVSDFGIFTFAFTVATIISYAADFGLSTLTVVEIAKNRTALAEYMGDLLIPKSAMCLGILLATGLVASWLNYPLEKRLAILLLTASVVVFSYVELVNSIFRGLERLHYETLITALANIVLLLSTLVILKVRPGIWEVSVAFLFSKLLALFLAAGLLRHGLSLTLGKFDIRAGKKILQKALPFALLFALVAVFFDADTILLSHLRGDQEVAYYQSGMKIIVSLTVIPHILVSSFLPVLSRTALEGQILKGLGARLVTVMFYVSIPLFILILGAGEQVIGFIYGEPFRPAVDSFRILGIMLVLRFWFRAYFAILLSMDKQGPALVAVAAATVANILVNLYFIPQFGKEGAACAAVITHGFLVLACMGILLKEKVSFMLDKRLGLIVPLGLVFAAFFYLVKDSNVIVIALIYLGCYLASTSWVVRREVTSIFRALWPLANSGGR